MRTMAGLAGLAALLAAAPAMAQERAQHQGAIPWMEDFDAGMNLARHTGKPVILYFSAEW